MSQLLSHSVEQPGSWGREGSTEVVDVLAKRCEIAIPVLGPGRAHRGTEVRLERLRPSLPHRVIDKALSALIEGIFEDAEVATGKSLELDPLLGREAAEVLSVTSHETRSEDSFVSFASESGLRRSPGSANDEHFRWPRSVSGYSTTARWSTSRRLFGVSWS